MGVETTRTLRCDICGRAETVAGEALSSPGWATIQCADQKRPVKHWNQLWCPACFTKAEHILNE